MTLKIIENRKIKSDQRHFNNFLERFHTTRKNFKIDCEAINVADYISSETTVTIRHRKPPSQSIYYAEVFKENNEVFYFFGLARDNVIATSNYLSQESHIIPILVASLHQEDSSKSNLVFASDSKEFNDVILLRIDCSELDEIELDVLKNKNKITKLSNGKGFINFGAIGDFNTLKNIRNFISNVKFKNENTPYVKLMEVSSPENYSAIKPDSSIVKDRFYNFNSINLSDDDLEDVIDLNETSSDGESISVDDESVESEIMGSDSSDNLKSISEDSDLFKYYYLDNDAIQIEMSICKIDFFKNMKIFNIFIDSYGCDLDYIEVLDMGDELLNIVAIFLIGINGDIEIIKEFFNLNDFVEKG